MVAGLRFLCLNVLRLEDAQYRSPNDVANCGFYVTVWRFALVSSTIFASYTYLRLFSHL